MLVCYLLSTCHWLQSLVASVRMLRGKFNCLPHYRLFKVDVSLREPLFLTYTFSGDPASGVRHYVQLKTSSKTVVLLDPNATPAGESSANLMGTSFGSYHRLR